VSFGALSVYWGAGGTWASSTIGPVLVDPVRDRDPGMVAIVHATGVAKLGAAALALALLGRWPQAAEGSPAGPAGPVRPGR